MQAAPTGFGLLLTGGTIALTARTLHRCLGRLAGRRSDAYQNFVEPEESSARTSVTPREQSPVAARQITPLHAQLPETSTYASVPSLATESSTRCAPSSVPNTSAEEEGAEKSAPPPWPVQAPSVKWEQSALSRRASKRMRRIAGQSWLSNRFGVPEIEEDFRRYTTRLQLKYLTRHIFCVGFFFCILVAYEQLLEQLARDAPDAPAGERRANLPYFTTAYVVSAALLLSCASLLSFAPSSQRHWRLLATASLLIAYEVCLIALVLSHQADISYTEHGGDCNAAATEAHSAPPAPEHQQPVQRVDEAAEQAAGHARSGAAWALPPADCADAMAVHLYGAARTYHAWRFGSLQLFQALVCLVGGLDYAHVVSLCVAGWLSLLLAEYLLYAWIRLTLNPLMAGVDASLDDAESAAVIDTLIAAPFTAVVMLYGARRINRFERLIFLQNYNLMRKADRNAHAFQGGLRQVLAFYFSPPGLDKQIPAELKKLLRFDTYRIGQELKYLLREVRPVFLHINPAASVDEARHEMGKHSPRVVMLSGPLLSATLHAGVATVFKPQGHENGHATLMDYNERIVAMVAASAATIDCVYLNAADTSALGHALMPSDEALELQLLHAMAAVAAPHAPRAAGEELSARERYSSRDAPGSSSSHSADGRKGGILGARGVVICWANRVDDAMARRAFAQGFLDEIGEALESAESAEGDADKTARLPVEAAFRAGVERFKAEGYRFGLQAEPHPAGHPHHANPDASCSQCLPNVHGQVILLTYDEGRVVCIEGGSESSAELGRLLATRGGALQSEEVRGLDKPKLPLKWLGQMLALLVLAVALSLLALALVDQIGSPSSLDPANLTQPATHGRDDG